MKYLVDTCVVSEILKPAPSEGVVDWFRETDEVDVAMSVVSLGELQKGIERLPKSKRRTELTVFVDSMTLRFEERLLPITADIGREWGICCAKAMNRGQPLHAIDAMIAATARVHELTVVTRNVRHFTPTGVSIVNPFEASGR